MHEVLKRSIAYVESSESYGTGFLIGECYLLTALHVVNSHEFPMLPDRSLSVTFGVGSSSPHNTNARVVADCWDASGDWVLLRLDEPPQNATPIRLKMEKEAKAQWESYGYSVTKPTGFAIDGRVLDYYGNLRGAPVIQLYSDQVAAGSGLLAQGFSGAPCIMGGDREDGFAIGILIAGLKKPHESQGATLSPDEETSDSTAYEATDAVADDKAADASHVPISSAQAAESDRERLEGGLLYACPIEQVIAKCPFLSIPAPTVAPLIRKSRSVSLLLAVVVMALGAFTYLLFQIFDRAAPSGDGGVDSVPPPPASDGSSPDQGFRIRNPYNLLQIMSVHCGSDENTKICVLPPCKEVVECDFSREQIDDERCYYKRTFCDADAWKGDVASVQCSSVQESSPQPYSYLADCFDEVCQSRRPWDEECIQSRAHE